MKNFGEQNAQNDVSRGFIEIFLSAVVGLCDYVHINLFSSLFKKIYIFFIYLDKRTQGLKYGMVIQYHLNINIILT